MVYQEDNMHVCFNQKLIYEFIIRGDQTFVNELNYCLDPFCSMWLFKYLDTDTRFVIFHCCDIDILL